MTVSSEDELGQIDYTNGTPLHMVMWYDVINVITSEYNGKKTITWWIRGMDPNSLHWTTDGYYTIEGDRYNVRTLSVEDDFCKLTLERYYSVP